MSEPQDATGEAPTSSRPRVVMLAANTIDVDARVIKAMNTVAQLGADVTAIGLGRPGFDSRVDLASDLRIIRVDVDGSPGSARPWFRSYDEYKRAVEALDRRREGTAPDAAAWVPVLHRAERLVLKARVAPVRLRALRAKRAAGSVPAAGDDLVGQVLAGLPAAARWRRVLPEILEQERVIGPLIDELVPDLIHVHDVYLVGIAVEAARRAAASGRHVSVVYDAHEFVLGQPMVAHRLLAAYGDLEREYISHVDRVITVSPPLADLLAQTYGLDATPDVVLNAPIADDPTVEVVGVRELCGLGADVPLVVYGGGVHAARGVQTVLGALEHLPDVHLVIVVRAMFAYSRELQAAADKAGHGDRVHFVPFVPPAFVPRYLSSATVGVSPLLHAVNHDVAITNKFCEYLQGGLPIVTSDTPAQADLVRELGLGEVHVAGDVVDCARAIADALAVAPATRARIEGDAELRFRFSWSAQAQVLRSVYDAVLPQGLPEKAWVDGATDVRVLRGQ